MTTLLTGVLADFVFFSVDGWAGNETGFEAAGVDTIDTLSSGFLSRGGVDVVRPKNDSNPPILLVFFVSEVAGIGAS
jgi:hypothetical protein